MNDLISLFAEANTDALKPVLDTAAKMVVNISMILIPILGAVVAALGIFKLITLGIKLSQTSDDPEARRRIIKAMIWWGIGVFICIVAIIVVPTVLFEIFGFQA